MDSIKTEWILRLLLLQYYDGRYCNSHPELMEWLDKNPEPHDYHIEQLRDEFDQVNYQNVRVWSSYEAMLLSKQSRARELTVEEKGNKSPRVEGREQDIPMMKELLEAVEQRNYLEQHRLCKMMREAGYKINLRKILEEKGKI